MRKITDIIKSGKKSIVYPVLILCAVLLLVAMLGNGNKTKDLSEEEILEQRLCEICEKIDGIDKAYVMVSFSDDEKDKSYFSLQSEDGDYRSVNGVGIVCTGGDTGKVKREVSEMISAILGIPISHVKVLGYGH